ncbi:hypothetical protein DZJ_40230 [Dickeya ananatis]
MHDNQPGTDHNECDDGDYLNHGEPELHFAKQLNGSQVQCQEQQHTKQ